MFYFFFVLFSKSVFVCTEFLWIHTENNWTLLVSKSGSFMGQCSNGVFVRWCCEVKVQSLLLGVQNGGGCLLSVWVLMTPRSRLGTPVPVLAPSELSLLTCGWCPKCSKHHSWTWCSSNHDCPLCSVGLLFWADFLAVDRIGLLPWMLSLGTSKGPWLLRHSN